MKEAIDGIKKFTELLPNNSNVLDIGCGDMWYTKYMTDKLLIVDTCDLFGNVTYLGDYNSLHIDKEYDGVWAANILEHQLNINNYLRKLKLNIKDNGVLCVSVPPLKHTIDSGHVSLWNAGLLLYNLVLAGISCHNAKIKKYGYQISIIIPKVKKFDIDSVSLTYNVGDLKTLTQYFPAGVIQQTIRSAGKFAGDIKEYNWK